MGTAGELPPGQADLVRAALPVLAAGSVVLAVATEPAGWVEHSLLVVAVALFVAWARWRLTAPLLAIGVITLVVLAQISGQLESSTFLLSVLAIAVTGWSRLGVSGGLAVGAMVATPTLIALIQPGSTYGWPEWTAGVALPAFVGWAFHRQEQLTAQLAEARRSLADQAILEERRLIARDVHDLVGHGLAAVMLQVTSARHVLRRDTHAADEALRSAEEVGRRSMRELRRTVALLRSDDEDAVAPPLPGTRQITDLVEAARTGGLRIEYVEIGDHDLVDSAVGLTLYRIAQESIANAVRHAPLAYTTVTLTVTDGNVVLEVESKGRTEPPTTDPDTDRSHYGLRGMSERADVVGGALQVGPTPDGWLVRCRIPLTRRADREAGEAT